jgi:2-dehydropantoate 2-reductase
MIHILVVGTGAVGSLYGGMLSRLETVKVSFLCRSDYEHISRHGVNIQSVWKNFHFHPDQVIKWDASTDRSFDYVLVSTKVLTDINPFTEYGRFVGKQTTIVLLQNGIGIEEPVQRSFPNTEIISGLAFTCIHRISPGQIHHIDYGHISIGLYTKNASVEKTKVLSDLFNQAGVPCEFSEDIVKARWKKLVWNAAFNPLSVLTKSNTTEILENVNTLELTKSIMQEVCKLAELDSHPLPADTISQFITMTLNMNPYKTSMLLDFESGRQMEIEAILGNAIRYANQYMLDTPYLKSIYSLLSLLQKKYV